MKKYLLLAAALLLLRSFHVHAQNGKVYDNLSVSSKILKMDRKYAIYLPPDYETSDRSYPVLYLLHGSGDDQTGWVQFGEVQRIADEAIRNGTAAPMIIVMPDANTGTRGYINRIDGQWNYEDFFFQELMPQVEKKYRIRQEKRYRAVAGLSMGGWGTFLYALHHPELFGAACPLSAAVGALNPEDGKRWYLDNGKYPMPDSTTYKNFYNKYSVLQLLNDLPDDHKKDVRWYIDCGDDDFLFEGNGLAHILMRKRDIPHEFRTRDGGHTWTYWRSALPSVLEFVSMSFHQY